MATTIRRTARLCSHATGPQEKRRVFLPRCAPRGIFGGTFEGQPEGLVMRRSRFLALILGLALAGSAFATEMDAEAKKKDDAQKPAAAPAKPAPAGQASASVPVTTKPAAQNAAPAQAPKAGQSVNTLEDIYVADARVLEALARQAAAAEPAAPRKE
jgi:hypothetical protein